MTVIVSLLRGINLAGHRKIKMDALRELYQSLGFKDVATFINSGNVLFRTGQRDPAALARRIENAIEGAFGFRSAVVLRTTAELRDALARNPFAARPGMDPAKVVFTFLAGDPGQAARDGVLALVTRPEELWIDGREMYIHFPNGMGRSKLPSARIERMLGTPGTARNLNTVRKLLELAEKMEAGK